MQIHGMGDVTTALMLRVYDGELRYYSTTVLETDVYDRWIKFNVIHDVDGKKITVFLDDVQMFEVQEKAPSTFYFKCGVYTEKEASHYMESRWKGIRVLKKDG